MPTEYERRQGFLNLAKQIAGLKTEILVRPDLGKELGFKHGEELFQSIIDFFKMVISVDWEKVPMDAIGSGSPIDFQSTLINLYNSLQKVISFSISPSENPITARDTLFVNIGSTWALCFRMISPYLVYLRSLDETRIAYAESEARTIVEQLKKIQTDLETKQKEAALALSSIQITAQEGGASKEAFHFGQLADAYTKAAVVWLLVGVVFGVVAGCYVKNEIATLQSPDIKTMLPLLIPRILAFSLLMTGLFFCLRNFSVICHNQIVNRHRQTALTTFQTFVNGTSDAHTKNAVLIQATRAIFLPQPSGFLKGETETPQISQITEVVRGLSEQGKPLT